MKLIFAVVVISCIVVDFLVPVHHHIPGFFALFGFISCVAIVVIAKLIGRYWLQRKGNYYD